MGDSSLESQVELTDSQRFTIYASKTWVKLRFLSQKFKNPIHHSNILILLFERSRKII